MQAPDASTQPLVELDIITGQGHECMQLLFLTPVTVHGSLRPTLPRAGMGTICTCMSTGYMIHN